MPALESKLRRDLERAIVEARNLAVAGVEAKLHELTVHEGKRGEHLSEDEAALRVRLRAHARQIGDPRNSQSGVQAIDRLVQACAYEQWHRMIFVRFLAENEFLLDPDYGQAVSMEDLREIADEANADPWELGSQFAANTLPAIFRPDDPLLQVKLSQETRSQLESLLDALPKAVFTADDSLGWVYQFWQSEEKDRVNREGEKIAGRTLPAVTQLFTEHYMVLFLLHNTIGAWHAGKVLAENPDLVENAEDEAELRRAVALSAGGGYDFEYLRFVREPLQAGSAISESDASKSDSGPPRPASGRGAGGEGLDDGGPWRPMGGTFPGWPKTATELKVLDPSCGSGHFLVAALELLVHLRMHEEGLSVAAAVEAVIRDNLFGLEIDPRCTQIAAFNVAMAAWKLAGPKPLPPMRNIACSGIPLGNSRDEWMKSLEPTALAAGLGFQWGQLYDMFSHADTLGSLINPQRFFGSGILTDDQLDQISTVLTSAIASDPHASSEQLELAAAAQGLTRATELLAGKYTLVVTNVPYLGRGKQDKVLKDYLDSQYALGKADLATAFVLRCLEFCEKGGSTALVTPQNWLFLTTYKKLRETLLERRQWDFVARLGPGAFETISGHVVNIALMGVTASHAADDQQMAGIDVSAAKQPSEKAAELRSQQPSEVVLIPQEKQLKNPDARITLSTASRIKMLNVYAHSSHGIGTFDSFRFCRNWWESATGNDTWTYQQSTPDKTDLHSGCHFVVRWENGEGELAQLMADKAAEGYSSGKWRAGVAEWGKTGIIVGQMNTMPCTLYQGCAFDENASVIIPDRVGTLVPIWCFVSSPTFAEKIREVDDSIKVTCNTLVKVPFDVKHWENVAAEKYPNGLPEPESDDPTQWLFHGRPEASTAPLQVAVARLLGYRWPAELDGEMRLSQRARDLVARCHELDEFVDDDGIVCIPSARGEDPAADRLLRLLNGCSNHSADPPPATPPEPTALAAGLTSAGNATGPEASAYGSDASGPEPTALAAGSASAGNATAPEANAYGSRFGDLGDWLRNRFFQEHCELFHQRPFIWHIWDGHKDGFSALVNYHKLAGPTGAKLLESLTYSYLGDWITRQEAAVKSNESGADARLIAARQLQQRLIDILHGEPPFDIFVRWKPLHKQPIGWQPDINDGVRMNIRPFMAADLPGGRKGAGVLRYAPKIKWTKDRGKEPKRPIEDYPWFWSWDEKTQDFQGGEKFTGERWNDPHYTNAFKQAAREAKNKEAQA